jgi:hypothetical protein
LAGPHRLDHAHVAGHDTHFGWLHPHVCRLEQVGGLELHALLGLDAHVGGRGKIEACRRGEIQRGCNETFGPVVGGLRKIEVDIRESGCASSSLCGRGKVEIAAAGGTTWCRRGQIEATHR